MTQRFVDASSVYDQAKAAGQWKAAIEAGEQMLAVAQADGLGQPLQVAIIDQIALANLNLGQYDNALAQYEQVIEAASTIRGTNTQETEMLNAMLCAGWTGVGRVHRLRDDQTKAVESFQTAIDHANRLGLRATAAQGSTELAFSLIELNRVDEAIAALKKGLPILKQAAHPDRETDSDNTQYANALHALGFAYDHLGRYDLGEPYHRQSLDVIVKNVGWKHNFTAVAANSLANSYQMQGRSAEAEILYRTVLVIYADTIGAEHPSYATTLNNLARMLETEQGKHQEAEEMAREALRLKRAAYGDESPETAISMVNLANILSFQDRLADAEPLADEALAVYEKTYGSDHAETAQTLQLLASIRLRQGKNAEGLKIIERALSSNERNPFPPDQAATLYATKALILQELGRNDDAAAAMDKALELFELQRIYFSGVERERASGFARYVDFFHHAIQRQAELGDVEAMFAISESMKARSLLDELQLHEIDLLAGLPPEERERLAAEESVLRRELTAATEAFDALPEVGPEPTQEQIARRREAAQAVLAAREALYEHLSEVKVASPVYRELITRGSETATLADLQQRLDDGELVLSYSVGKGHSYVIVIRKDSAEFSELVFDEAAARRFGVEPGAATSKKLAAALVSDEHGVMPGLSDPTNTPNDFAEKLAALWTVLVPEPQRQALTSGEIKRLVVLPADSLSLLPLEALVVRTNDNAFEFLLDVDPPVAYAPSATVLLSLADREEQASGVERPVLTLGNPAYPQEESQPDAADRLMAVSPEAQPMRAALSLLPHSGWEAKWVKEHFEKAGIGATLLTGAAATEAAVRREAPGCQIVHLACHGMADQSYQNFFGELALMPGRGGDPADDGVLSMSEIYGLDLTGCELAVLSACQTNYGPEQQGEGVWALSRGFLVAGAKRVIASNWVVSDEAGATLISYYTDYLTKSGNGPAEYDYATALQRAKRVVRKKKGWIHPFYWSTMVLIGPAR